MSPVASNPSNGKNGSGDVLERAASLSKMAFPKPPTFTDKLEERAFLKFRLAQAFRIFGECNGSFKLVIYLTCLIIRQPGV